MSSRVALFRRRREVGGGEAEESATVDYWLAKNFVAGTGIVGSRGKHTAADPGGTATPLRLNPESTGFLYLPGTAGNTVLSSSVAGPTGDFEVRAAVALTDWNNGSFQEIVAQWHGASPSAEAWLMGIRDTGILRLIWRDSGGTVIQANSTEAPPGTNGSPLLIWAVLDVDNGAGGYTVTFYTKEFVSDYATELADNSGWTQLGDPVVGGSTTSVQSVNRQIDLMGSAGLGRYTQGKLYAALVKKGAGTTMVDPDFTSDPAEPYSSFSDTAGNTWTINRSSSGLKSTVVTPSVGPVLACAGDYLSIPDHEDLRFAADQSFTAIVVVRIYGTGAARQAAIGKANTADMGWVMIEGGSATNWFSRVYDGAGSDFVFGPARTSGQLHTLALQLDRSTEQLEAVLDGVASGSPEDTTGRGAIGDNAHPVRLMALVNGQHLHGEFIAAGIYREAMTAAEIEAEGTRLIEENAA